MRLPSHSLIGATTAGGPEDMGPPPAFAVPGSRFGAYTVQELLYQGRRSVVVRCLQDGVPVVVKFLRRAQLGPGDVARFRREYELSRRVRHAHVVSADTLDSHGGVLFLAMPDDGAVSLRSQLQHGPLPLADALRIAIAVVDALEAIHGHNILHKDIAPSNIIADLARGTVKLIDFGIAADMSVERPQATSLRDLEGTLAYIAPEQTGRMHRDLDYRADFYALGATLFELLTGSPPFGAGQDPVQAVHAHLARTPQPAHSLRPDAPTVLSGLVARLLAKDPEARYQNHQVLRRDLQRILQHLHNPQALDALVLAQGDLSERFQVSGRLYGRADGVRRILDVFEAAATGPAHTVTIAGVSGIGKTALVGEVQRSLLGHRGHMVSGKFNQFGQHTPCAAFVQALEQRARQVLALPPDEQAVWREALLSLLGPNAAMARTALPELGVLLGDALPPVAELGPTEAENRFLRSMQQCFAALARADAPLVVFIDDLQWADRVSRRLLRELALDEGLQHILLIAAYRADEVPPDHPLQQDLTALASNGGRSLALSVGALQADDVAQLLADTLQQPLPQVQTLAQLCLEKTGGNPFFLGRFLEDLHRRQLIWLDRSQPRWCWSEPRIRSEHIADNVVALMLEQLRRLPPDTGSLLTTAACLGSRFTLDTLGTACQRPSHTVLRALAPALAAGLLVPQDTHYQWMAMLEAHESQGLRVELAFVHDRVQEAAYLLAAPAERPALHLRIGRLLRDGAPGQPPDFAVVNHLNQGQALMDGAAERRQLADFNAQASQWACAAASFDLAADYAAQAIALRGATHWQDDPATALDLQVHAARMAALKGDAAAMDALIDTALPCVADPSAHARLLDVRIESFYASGRLDETLELGLSVLRLLGTAPPVAATPAAAMQLVAAARAEIDTLGIDTMAAQPAMTDPLCLQQLSVIAKMTAAAYIARPALLLLLTVMQVRLMVARGHAPAALSAYSVMGLMVAEFLRDYRFGTRLGRMSMALIERHGWRHVQAHAGFSFNAFLRHWTEGIASGLPALREVHQQGLENGSLRHAGLALYVHDYHAFLTGTPLAELDTMLALHATTLRRIRQPVAQDYQGALRAAIHTLRQPRFADVPMETKAFSAQQLEQTYTARADQTGTLFLQAWRCMLYTLAGQPDAAVAAGDAAQLLFPAGRGMVMVPFCLFFTAMAALDRNQTAGSPSDAQLHTRCTAALDRLALWAQTCADVRPLQHLLRARILLAGVLPHTAGAAPMLAEFDAAHQAAQAIDNLLVQGLVHRYRSQALVLAGPPHAAAANAERAEARALFLRWGSRALVDAMALEEHTTPRTVPHVPLAALHADTGTETDTVVAVPGSALDLSTLMKSVQAVTGETTLDTLLVRLVHVLRESAGASRASIVLRDQGQWVVQADSGIDGPAAAIQVMEGLPLEEAATRLPREMLRTVLSTASPVLVHDAAHDPAWRRLPYFRERTTRSVLCMPLVRQGRVLGALYLENEAVSGAFSPERIVFLELLSGNVVNAIDNARLVTELRSLADTLEQRVADRTRELRESEGRTLAILQNAPLPMTVTRTADNVFVYANERAAELAGMPAAALLGREPRSMYRSPADRDQMLEQYRREGVLRDYEMCLVVAQGREIWALISMVPIIYDGQPCALSTIIDINERKGMENALRQIATTDSMTGMASRSHFMGHAEAELARARRHSRPLSMVMLDVDHFKQINDRHGHAMGDSVLRVLTRTCRSLVRQQDLVGRLGGEEFGILMPETDSENAFALAERLRSAIAALYLATPRNATVAVTASFGISTLLLDDTLDSLLARADAGLYLSKNAGRNRVSCAPVQSRY
ncbi:diguanylate cyclase [Rhodoferax sp.]|uniref:diguanylate cyclase n=1 Tax=Rhodoferax sp. TaxID=50421 RepID=UPI0025E10228|nr:diguanylate cyclase [Rhodoferax sp.]